MRISKRMRSAERCFIISLLLQCKAVYSRCQERGYGQIKTFARRRRFFGRKHIGLCLLPLFLDNLILKLGLELCNEGLGLCHNRGQLEAEGLF